MGENEKFDFEKLNVWKKAVEFADKVFSVLESINSDRKHYRLSEQTESAVTSISMNIAEGKGRYSKKEFIQFLYYARGSIYETVTLLTIFEKRKWILSELFYALKNMAVELSKMLNGLIRSIKNSL